MKNSKSKVLTHEQLTAEVKHLETQRQLAMGAVAHCETQLREANHTLSGITGALQALRQIERELQPEPLCGGIEAPHE